MDGETGARRFFHLLVQMGRRRNRDAIVVRLAFIRLEHLGRTCAQRAIGKDLQRAKTQPFVAKARTDA